MPVTQFCTELRPQSHLLESCCILWDTIPVALSYRNTDVRDCRHPLFLVHACAGGAQARVGVRAFSHEYLQSYVHSIASVVSFHSRWRQKWKGKTFIRKSLFVWQSAGALQAWGGGRWAWAFHYSSILPPAAVTAARWLRKLDLERIRSFFCLCLTCFPSFSKLNCDS